jgi:hypothetical protein
VPLLRFGKFQRRRERKRARSSRIVVAASGRAAGLQDFRLLGGVDSILVDQEIRRVALLWSA